MIILLEANWFFSMNAGRDCESTVVEVFNNEREYNEYFAEHLTNAMFNKNLDLGEKPKDNQYTTWLYTQEYKGE